jgi:hypothetical protein
VQAAKCYKYSSNGVSTTNSSTLQMDVQFSAYDRLCSVIADKAVPKSQLLQDVAIYSYLQQDTSAWLLGQPCWRADGS